MNPSSFPFARRTQWNLTNNPLMMALEAKRRDQVPLLDLVESNPTRCELTSFDETGLQALANRQNLHYEPDASGHPAAKQAVVAYYARLGIRVTPERIFLTSSTSEAYSFLMRLLVNADDRVLVPVPSYPLFEYLLQINDAHEDNYPYYFDANQWVLDTQSLSDVVQEGTRAIIVVNPNNPTGSLLKAGEISALNAIAKEHQLALISDEVFLDYPLIESARPMSLAGNDQVLTFTLGGISKVLALPQMKLGWIVVNGPADEVRDACARLDVILDTFLSVNTPTQNALSDWMGRRDKIQDEIRYRLKTNWQVLSELVAGKPSCQFLPAEAGWYAVLKLPSLKSEEEWVMTFLQEDNVFVHPGYFFDFYDEPLIVLSLLTAPAVFVSGLQRILRRL